MFKNRRGILRISAELLDREPLIVRCVMSRLIVFRAEYMYQYNAIEYHALSMEFDIVPHAEITPEYKVLVSEDTGISFIKVEQ